jgi:hypothetical protein
LTATAILPMNSLMEGGRSLAGRRLPLWRLIPAAVIVAVSVAGLSAAKAEAYVNPFSQGVWSPGRIDMGVDMIPEHREPSCRSESSVSVNLHPGPPLRCGA